MVDYVIGS